MWYAIDFSADKSNFLVGTFSDSWSNGALPIALNLSYPLSLNFQPLWGQWALTYPWDIWVSSGPKFAAKIEFSFFIFSLLWIIKQPFIKPATRRDVGDNFLPYQVVTHYAFSETKKTTRWLTFFQFVFPSLSRGTLGRGEPCPSQQQILCREPAITLPRNIDNQSLLAILSCKWYLDNSLSFLKLAERKNRSKSSKVCLLFCYTIWVWDLRAVFFLTLCICEHICALIEMLSSKFTSNGKREFVPRDQVSL